MLRSFFSRSNLAGRMAVAVRYLQRMRFRGRMEGESLYIAVIAGSLLLAFVWASCAEIDRVVRVSGKIIPAGRGREIQHLEGGIIASINTYEGAVVKSGDVLMSIEDVAAGASLGETKVKLTAQRARVARLSAEVNAAMEIDFSDDLKQTPMANSERSLFLSRTAKLNQEILVHEGAIRQYLAKLNELRGRQSKLLGERRIANARLNLLVDMASRGAASKMEVLDAQSRQSRLDTEISDVVSSIPTMEAVIAEERSRAQALRVDFINTAQTDLVAAQAEVDRLNQVMLGASDRVKRTEIRAPIDGIINRIAVNTLGGVIKSGDKLIELIPVTKEVLIEARAQPKDRGHLRPGLNATVRLSAYDAGEVGALKSKVTEVSADTMLDAKGESFYRVNMLVSDIPTSYKNNLMVPGMTATADIVTGRRTVMSLILSPIRKFTYSMFRDSR